MGPITAFVTLVTLALMLPADVRGETYLVGLKSYPPYMIVHEDEVDGIYADIFGAISEVTGDQFEFMTLPHRRLNHFFELGEIDIEPGIAPVWRADQETPGLYTRPFLQMVDVTLFPDGKTLPIQAPEDLNGLRLGIRDGFYYPGFTGELDQDEIMTFQALDEHQLMTMLAADRLDVAFINQRVARYWSSRSPEFSELVEGNSIGQENVGMRIHPSQQELAERMDRALQKLLANGTIEEIIQNYVEDAPAAIPDTPSTK